MMTRIRTQSNEIEKLTPPPSTIAPNRELPLRPSFALQTQAKNSLLVRYSDPLQDYNTNIDDPDFFLRILESLTNLLSTV